MKKIVPPTINSPKKTTVASLYRAYSLIKYKARKRQSLKGREYSLTFEEWKALYKQNCYLCGAKPSNKISFYEGETYYGYESIIYQSIDRINSLIGYRAGNVAPCCKTCNILKFNLTLSALRKHIKKILKHNPKLIAPR